MRYSDFAIENLVRRLAELFMKKSTPKKWAGVMYEAMEVIQQLRKAAAPPNDPLTLDELREMDLLEWLWIEMIHPTESQVFHKIESAYYQVFEDYTEGEALCCGWPGLIHEFEYMDYSKTWLAYRRKPEKGTT